MSVTTRPFGRAPTTLVSLILGLDPAVRHTAADDACHVPSPLAPGGPGTLIAAERTTVNLLPGWPLPATAAWRLVYRSTSATGEPIGVTGTLMVPEVAWPGPGARPLVGYAVGGHGVGPQCTPSLQFRKGTQMELAVVAAHLAQGWAVVVTDYQRVPAPTFLNARASGQAVLDAVRAGRRVAEAGALGAGGAEAFGPVALHGYGQGGTAVAAAAELQPSYAPDVELRGVAAGGVVADLAGALRSLDGGARFGLVPLVLAGLRAAHPELPIDGLSPTGQAAVRAATAQCLPDMLDRWAYRSARELTSGGVPVDRFLADERRWRARVDEQRIGLVRPAAPVHVYHAARDPWSDEAAARRLAAEWRARGADVTVTAQPLAEHGGALVEAVPAVRDWLAARLVAPFGGTA